MMAVGRVMILASIALAVAAPLSFAADGLSRVTQATPGDAESAPAAEPAPKAAAPAKGGGPSEALRVACTDDAHKFCESVITNTEKRRACMRQHYLQLSKGCVAAIKASR
jgi:hypothetical protein